MTSRLVLLAAFVTSTPAIATPAVVDLDAPTTSHPDEPFTPSLSHDGATAQIINGQRVNEDWFPMTGGLIFTGSSRAAGSTGDGTSMQAFTCSSTLIAPDVVLTAAHCVDPEVFNQTLAFQGQELASEGYAWSRQPVLSDITPFSALPDDAIEAVAWSTPDAWSIQNMSDLTIGSQKNDIALVFLSEAVTDVDPALLPLEGESADLATGDEVEVVGWGTKAELTILDSFSPGDPEDAGKKIWGITQLGEIGTYEIQVGIEDEDVRKCKGDSGGPTFMALAPDSARPFRLIGVTSRSFDFTQCAETGGVDTRVDAYLDWIESEMLAACDDGRRVACEEPGLPTAAAFEPEEVVGACNTSGGLPSGWLWLGASAALLGLRRRQD